MQLSDIAIFAVYEDGDLDGFSFDAEPGRAEQHRIHKPVNPDDPGSDLRLVGFRTRHEAAACIYGLLAPETDDVGWLVHTFADDLTCVLIDFKESAESALLVEDTRSEVSPDGGAS